MYVGNVWPWMLTVVGCCRQNQLPSALASLSQARVMVREGSDLSKEILITMATALLAMGDFNQSLRYIHVHILHLSIQYNTISPVLSSVQVSGYDPQDRKKLCGSFVGES